MSNRLRGVALGRAGFSNGFSSARPSAGLSTGQLLALLARVSVTRSGTATRFNELGALELVSANTARIDYNPATLARRGLLIEESRVNRFLNSLIDGTNLATQGVAVAAAAQSMSLYGDGSITLSGVSSAGPLAGSGAFPTRSILNFTPTAGTLTCTVAGNAQQAQIEAGAIATSFIPTAGSPVTRSADQCLISGTAFSSFWNPVEGTVYIEYEPRTLTPSATRYIFTGNDGTANNQIYVFHTTAGNIQFQIIDNLGSVVVNQTLGAAVLGVNKIALALKANDTTGALNGVVATADTSCTIPTIDRISVGANRSFAATSFINGWVKALSYSRRRENAYYLQKMTT